MLDRLVDDWFEKETDGTLNILCSSWMDWFHGGLQFQIEHHLFLRLVGVISGKFPHFLRSYPRNTIYNTIVHHFGRLMQ